MESSNPQSELLAPLTIGLPIVFGFLGVVICTPLIIAALALGSGEGAFMFSFLGVLAAISYELGLVRFNDWRKIR